MKRGRDQLTGGTGDVSPQILTMAITMTGPNTFTQTEIPLPIARFREKGKRVTVLEVLKVMFDTTEYDSNPTAGGSVATVNVQLSTASQTFFSSAFTQVFAFGSKVYRGAFTAGGTYAAVINDPQVVDLSDGAGHGILVATDNIFIGMNTTGFLAAASAVIKMVYRFKEVDLSEYIGIVQSQQ